MFHLNELTPFYVRSYKFLLSAGPARLDKFLVVSVPSSLGVHRDDVVSDDFITISIFRGRSRSSSIGRGLLARGT